MALKLKEQCPECGHKYNKKPIYTMVDGKKVWNLRNLLLPDPIMVWIIISILMIVVGVAQMNERCLEVAEDPVGWCEDMGCEFPEYKMDYSIGNNTLFQGFQNESGGNENG